MRKRVILASFVLFSAGVWGWCVQPRPTPSERIVVWWNAESKFSSELWKTADARGRGRMLHDLLRRYDFVGKSNVEVTCPRILGPPGK